LLHNLIKNKNQRGLAGPGMVRHGKLGQGVARRGAARQDMDGVGS